MPALTYTNQPFVKFTKILSSVMNQYFTDITTLLNTTKLDDANLQVNGITRNGATSKLKTGTANYVVINGSDGNMSEEASLAMTRGGTGQSLTLTNSGDVLQVNSNATALILAPAPNVASSKVFSMLNF